MPPFAELAPLAVVEPMPAEPRLAGLPTLTAHPRGSAQRATLEAFVQSQYLVHFAARIEQFMPLLLALHDSGGEPRAVVGCRAAGAEPLFLETYTREPIERVVSRIAGAVVARRDIVEIGGLACRGPRAAADVVKALVPFLLASGFSWVVFTGADTVKNVFRRLGLAPTVLCRADQALLGDARHAWGTYYDHHPEVMAGRLREGERILRAAGGLQ